MRRLIDLVMTFRLWLLMWGRVPTHPLMAVIKPKPSTMTDNGCSALGIGGLLILALPVMWVVGFGLALMAIVIGGTLRGLLMATLTARAIYRERGIGRIDLLGLAPAGSLGAGWVLALREFRLSKAGQFVNRYIHNAQRIIGIGGLVMVTLITLGTLIFQFDGVRDVGGTGVTPSVEYVLGAVQLVVISGLWLFSDNAQSPLIGALVGIWAGFHARRQPEAAGVAAVIYGTVQMLLFALALFIWNMLVNEADGIRLGAIVVTIIVLREIILRVAWTIVCRDLNATGAELPSALAM